MCLGGSSQKAPAAPDAVPEAAQLPTTNKMDGSSSLADKRRRAAAAAAGDNGMSTILTSSRGVQTSGQTAGKTLLGQ